MERLFIECFVRAALLVGGTAIVLYAMRVKTAAARHRVWAGVMALMLALPIWTAWGPKASLRVLPTLAESNVHEAIVPTHTLSAGVLITPRESVLRLRLCAPLGAIEEEFTFTSVARQ
jgi:hypothetical protein